ncbi:LOW QUALITY PROTEIN: hypothetical protein HID58_044453, partial [Brassica napus]
DQRVVSSIEEYGEGAFFFPNQEPQEQQAVVNYVNGQNLEQQAAVNYIGGQNYVQNKGLNKNYPHQRTRTTVSTTSLQTKPRTARISKPKLRAEPTFWTELGTKPISEL